MSYYNYVYLRRWTKAYYDGRCGNGPVLMCECVAPNYCNAEPIPAHTYRRHHDVIHGRKL